jgi:hypothetical protein
VVYCEAGVRSKKGANALLDSGYTNVIDVTDGIRGWRALGGEIVFPVTDTTILPPTTTLPSTTEGPTVTTTPSTTIIEPSTSTTTEWAPTTTISAEPSQRYLDVEPLLVMDHFEGTEKIHMNMWEAIKIGDAYIYITGDFDGCVGLVWWTFNIYHDTAEGGVWEGKSPSYMNEEVHSSQDISGDIHKVSDAMDGSAISLYMALSKR